VGDTVVAEVVVVAAGEAEEEDRNSLMNRI
jgi:hypothetical protein